VDPSTSLLWRLFAEAMVTFFRRDREWEAHLTPTSALVVTGEPRADSNLMTIDASPDAADLMRGYAGLLRARRLPFAAFVTDAASDLVEPEIRGFGLLPAARVPLMTWRPLALVTPARDLAISIVDDEPGLRQASRVLASAFAAEDASPPPVPAPLTLAGQGVTRFLARVDGVPVSAVSTTRAGAIAGIWSMGTDRRYQGRGFGRAILDYAIAHEQRAGATFFFLGASDEGRPLYEKVGFREVASAQLWVTGPPVPSGR
jgi:ribosomal protein S18 acetylase RimI-like enzyme